MFMKKPTHRNFDYTPRYYDPLKDDEERKRRKIRIGFANNRVKPKNSLLKNIILIIIILVIYWIISH